MKKLLTIIFLTALLLSCKSKSPLSTDVFIYSDKLVEDMKKLEEKTKYASLENEFPIIETKDFVITNKYVIPFLYYELSQYGENFSFKDIPSSTIEKFFETTGYSRALNEIMYREAKKQKVVVSDDTVDEKIVEISKGDIDKFKKNLESSPFSFDFVVNDIKQVLTIQKYEDEVLTNNIKIDIKEIEKYYNDNPVMSLKDAQVKVRHILIKTDGTNKKENKEALKKITDIQQQIKDGKDFGELAKEHSDDPGSKINGGLLGDYIHPGQTVPEFEQEAFSLKNGEVSDIIKTNFGYHILKVEENKNDGKRDFQEMKTEIESKIKSEKIDVVRGEEKERIEKKYKLKVVMELEEKEEKS